MTDIEQPQSCRYCGAKSPEGGFEMRRISQRGRDYRNKPCMVQSTLPFCKGTSCGGYYQMGCEG